MSTRNYIQRKRLAAVGLFLLLNHACATGTDPYRHENLDATLWVQTSSEYYALARQTYRSATEKLSLALADPSWTAATEQTSGYEELPPAVILDVDETVLDNSAYAARKIVHDAHYESHSWAAWCSEAVAPPVPGSLAFTQFAARNGVTVFYLTSRNHAVEAVTRENLAKHGFPVDPKIDTVLTRREKPD